MIEVGYQHRVIAAKYPYEIAMYGTSANGLLIFQPRDGRRYEILFRAMSLEESRMLGLDREGSLVAVSLLANAYRAAVFTSAPHHNYLIEKLACSATAAVALRRALLFLFDAQDPGPFYQPTQEEVTNV